MQACDRDGRQQWTSGQGKAQYSRFLYAGLYRDQVVGWCQRTQGRRGGGDHLCRDGRKTGHIDPGAGEKTDRGDETGHFAAPVGAFGGAGLSAGKGLSGRKGRYHIRGRQILSDDARAAGRLRKAGMADQWESGTKMQEERGVHQWDPGEQAAV